MRPHSFLWWFDGWNIQNLQFQAYSHHHLFWLKYLLTRSVHQAASPRCKSPAFSWYVLCVCHCFFWVNPVTWAPLLRARCVNDQKIRFRVEANPATNGLGTWVGKCLVKHEPQGGSKMVGRARESLDSECFIFNEPYRKQLADLDI